MHVNTMAVRRFSSAVDAARTLARRVATDLAKNPTLVIGLPTGRTPVLFYDELVRLHARRRADFRHTVTFNLDEFVGVGRDDPSSYRTFMQRHLFDHVNVSPRRIHFLDGLATDAVSECRRYERHIARAGGIDLLVLGLGVNGHIGFNEPGASLVAATHKTALTRATRRANAAIFGGRISNVPTHALSMGMGTILLARRIVLLATGRNKSTAVRRLVEGRITPWLPASLLQVHPAVEVWVDAEAAAKLTARGE